MTSVRKTGDWRLARQLLATTPVKLKVAADIALKQEAEHLRKEIVQGITKQAPGGEAFKPLSPLTEAARRLAGFKGTKALMVRGDLRNAIAAIVRHGEAFIGVPRKAKDSEGKPTIDVAKLNEFGSDPIVIPITKKMRAYLAALFAEVGVGKKSGSGKGVVITQIPARPFLRPAFDKFVKGAHHRFMNRVSRLLKLGGV